MSGINKKKIMIPAVAALAALIAAVVFFSGAPARKLAAQLDLGNRYLEEMDYEQAVVAFTKAIEIDPMSVDAYLGLVEAYIGQGDLEQALEAAKKGYEATKDERLSEKVKSITEELTKKKLAEQLALGNRYLEEMDYAKAIAAFNKALEIDPMSVEAYLGLVEAYIRSGDFEKALEVAKKGYEKTKDARLKEKIDMLESGNVSDSLGREMKMTFYDNSGAVSGWIAYTYNQKGQQDSVASYDKAGREMDRIALTYDEKGRMLTSYGFSGGGDAEVWIHLIKQYYQGNVEIKSEYYNDAAGSELSSYSLYEYDGNGNVSRENNYGADGTLFGYVLLEYNANGQQTKRSGYEVSGKLFHYETYEYNENGNLIRQEYHNGDGTLTGYMIYEHDESGKYIGSKSYDGNGKLLSESN